MKWDASVSTRICFLSIKGDGLGPGAHRLGLVTACYIVGMFVMGLLNEARYSLISVSNEF
jgi:hypothetical protein